ncbi:sulfur carrier protein ThiS [Aestuariirhabdus litorea]|uniref:Sulfur carrier protein ThiS n=1 Tax=Aestuariirhabdus litorea TaxID=2528527 RepID=A0A3P3VJ39_9GAMM|nr:sulfur carrier protein ThiS [Aestuariirhabdus litorea]RRJ82692.1 sulfur carrier protein ThiS [Aestuariirhabdus litorea]RWW92852.1 sulfur carrier protein ThiS [Endozoicomonadaceae bacterium GTF-13]
MQIQLNGEAYQLEEGSTLATLITGLEMTGRIAVELNLEIVPRSEHAEKVLQPGDRVEIVRAIGGG